eukprot:6200030-Pleurochrysis_carterae.AAC.2
MTCALLVLPLSPRRLNEITRRKATNKELKKTVDRKDGEILILKSQVLAFEAHIKLVVKENELEMRDKINEVYETGRLRAMAQLKEAERTQQNAMHRLEGLCHHYACA